MRSQGLWYSGAFLLTFFPQLLLLLGIPFWAQLLFVSLPFNLIGFSNAVIYVRPRFLVFRREHPDLGVASSIWHTLARTRPVRREQNMLTSRTSTAYSSSSNWQVALPSTESSLAAVGSTVERNPLHSPAQTSTSGQEQNNSDVEKCASIIESEDEDSAKQQDEEVPVVAPREDHIEEEDNGADLEIRDQ